MLRIRKVSTELTPLVEWVLKRDEFRYTLQDMGGYTEFRIEDISSRRFNDVIEDAKCEKERRESLTPEIPVLSYRALMNPEREARLLRLYGADCCIPYSKDVDKYIEAERHM